MLIDTDVLIWVFRGNIRAARAVDAAETRTLSVITYMELLQGVRDKGEMKSIKSFLSNLQFRMLPLSENIGHRASIYLEEYGPAFAMHMADALIAATAVEHQETLLTGDRKHYKPIKELEKVLFRP